MRIKDQKKLAFWPLLVAIVLVAVGALSVGNAFIWSMLRSNAESNAVGWGNFIVDRVPQIERVIDGDQPVEFAAAYLQGHDQFGTIRRFKLFDKFGRERIDSRATGFKPMVGSGAPLNSAAYALINHQTSSFDFTEQIIDGETRYTARVMVPLEKYGEVVGAMEVQSDETANWTSLQNQFRLAAMQILGLVFVAFMLPGVLYLRRTGQLEFVARRLQQTAAYDELTGALNRTAFTSVLQDQIYTAEEHGMSVAVHFIDLDRFKAVNDTRGHAIGDQLLTAAAQRLRRLLGTRERLARLGADEFAISQPYYRASSEVVRKLAEDISREMAKPFILDDTEITIGASVGYSYYPTDGRSVEELIRAADIALHKAKDRARGKALAFDRSMEAERQFRQWIENHMRTALTYGEFELHYQPYFTADGKHLKGFEALLRLYDEQDRPISPAIFIPIAEEIGLIGAIGEWVLQAATRAACEWPDDLTVSVNLSPAQFHTHDMPSVVSDALERSGLDARRLELEVTESLLIADTDRVLEDLRKIKGLGVSIALDDFGTGYSSLGHLWRFPFDKLKVDKSFMSDLVEANSKSREILSTIVALGKVLDLKVTAEGVEKQEQAEVLKELQCDFIQGFLYGTPHRADDLGTLLARKVEQDLEAKGVPSVAARRRQRA